jgi:hypothetical protein
MSCQGRGSHASYSAISRSPQLVKNPHYAQNPAAVLTFFIAGLLYLLRFKRVDNLGAYSIPSETGLSIPSVYISYPQP